MAGRTRAPKALPAPTTDDPIELALEAAATGETPSDVVRALIENQSRLVGWQIATERAAFALKTLTVVVGITVALIVGAVLFSASQYRGLTVQPFSVPPELEARGLTGAAVATRVLDKLTAMQTATTSVRAANTYANSWGDEAEVTIPQTGVSAGDLWKFLRSWLGEEIKITGELVRIDDGVQLTTRAGGEAAPLVTGSEAELESLLDRAAEALYARTQPYRYAVYLSRTGRNDEAIAAMETLSRNGGPIDRKWALAGLAPILAGPGRLEEARDAARAAIALDDRFGLGHANLGGVSASMGDLESAYRAHKVAIPLLETNNDIDPERGSQFLATIKAGVASYENDHGRVLQILAAHIADAGISNVGLALTEASALVALHQPSEAERRLRPYLTEAGGIPADTGVRFLMAARTGDWRSTADLFAAVVEAAPDVETRQRLVNVRGGEAAYALARLGDFAGAAAILERARPDSYPARIGAARIAAVRGDTTASERLFAEAAAMAPSLADVHLAWGRARLERGDRRGAVEQFALAAGKAPRWADPLKYQGDALTAGGDHRGAIRKYRAAAQRAQRWGALHLAWGRALEAEGRRNEAVAKYRAAAGMDLSAADRAELTRRLAGTGR